MCLKFLLINGNHCRPGSDEYTAASDLSLQLLRPVCPNTDNEYGMLRQLLNKNIISSTNLVRKYLEFSKFNIPVCHEKNLNNNISGCHQHSDIIITTLAVFVTTNQV